LTGGGRNRELVERNLQSMMVRCKLRKKKYQAKQSFLKHIEIGETGRGARDVVAMW